MAKTITESHTSIELPAARQFSLLDAQHHWQVSRPTAWRRLRRAVQTGRAHKLVRGVYAAGQRPKGREVTPDVEALLAALQKVRAFRYAVSGLDRFGGSLHYIPTSAPHLLLVDRRAVDVVRRALTKAGYLAVSPQAISGVWDAQPSSRVVVLKPTGSFRGVPQASTLASPERALLDLLVEVRHHGFPFPAEQLDRLWRDLDSAAKDRVRHLGKELQIRPFYGRLSGDTSTLVTATRT